jgi:hypothetical protein
LHCFFSSFVIIIIIIIINLCRVIYLKDIQSTIGVQIVTLLQNVHRVIRRNPSENALVRSGNDLGVAVVEQEGGRLEVRLHARDDLLLEGGIQRTHSCGGFEVYMRIIKEKERERERESGEREGKLGTNSRHFSFYFCDHICNNCARARDNKG